MSFDAGLDLVTESFARHGFRGRAVKSLSGGATSSFQDMIAGDLRHSTGSIFEEVVGAKVSVGGDN